MISGIKSLDNFEDTGALLPIGYKRGSDNSIHIGRNIWLSNEVYDNVSCISKTPAAFVKNIAIAVYGATTLKNSSVTGKVSNRVKGTSLQNPRPKLDTKRLLAIKDILQYWLRTVKKYDAVAIDLEASQVGKHLSQKIYELNRVIKSVESASSVVKSRNVAPAAGDAMEQNRTPEMSLKNGGQTEEQNDISESPGNASERQASESSGTVSQRRASESSSGSVSHTGRSTPDDLVDERPMNDTSYASEHEFSDDD